MDDDEVDHLVWLQVDHPLAAGLSVSLGLAYHYPSSPDEATDTTLLLLPQDKKSSYSTMPGDTRPPEVTSGRTTARLARNRKLNLFIIWLSAFLSACCIFTFNVIIADYLGKVVYGGQFSFFPF